MTEASWTEANPLLPSSRVPGGDEPRSNSDSRIAAAARITAALVGSALLVAGAVVATSAKSAAPPPSRTSLSSQFKKDPTDVLIYKRTNPTTNPAEDCMWLTNNLGLQCQYAEMTLDGNDTSHGDWCGARAEAMAGNFNVHHIKDMFGPYLSLSTHHPCRILHLTSLSSSSSSKNSTDQQSPRATWRNG